MKKYIVLFTLFVALNSCSLDDNNNSPKFYTEFMPITNVDVPDMFIYGETYEIFMSYNRPNDCYVFNNIAYHTDVNERTIAVLNTVYTDVSCTGSIEETEVSFDISINTTETYVFKFYQGLDEGGSDQYHIIEVPVIID